MKLLSLDTSTEACTAAVWVDGVVNARFELGTSHSDRILTLVQEVLADSGLALSQLDAIAFGRGPGSFTGLRIGAGVTQGLAFGADLPVVPVSSLAAVAQGEPTDKVLAAFDARMNQVYWGAYVRNARGLMELVGTESVLAPTQISLPDDAGWIGAGNGWDQYAEALQTRLGDRVTGWRKGIYPHARYVAALGVAGLAAGQAVAAELAVPVYIRDDVAIKQPRR